ncbi:macro domain-containing protein [Rahnella sp. BCC 1045]|uniref:macro domain-containing protein n=1 Tax=Rahnella sp. BCC 1045 TaxID=2816251 RepID=UPI001C27E126|nr:macro domain-containing protein [Rahnella sp. BCC 1045]MBU9819643.1 macro domain-containing protein [Rahnella sp. BCC 1045]
MDSQNSLFINFIDVRSCTLLTSGQPYQRVRFRTLHGLHYDPLKVAITRLVGEEPDNLTWDAQTGEGAFCLLQGQAGTGQHTLPYGLPVPKRHGALLKIVKGDLFEQDADCVVNPWNFNLIPHWLLMPGGVSGQLKRIAGTVPFRQVSRKGLMWPGTATLTEGGALNRPVIHVGGLNFLWRSSPDIVFRCTLAALRLAAEHNFSSVAFPLIGCGNGGLDPALSLAAITGAARASAFQGKVIIVQRECDEGSTGAVPADAFTGPVREAEPTRSRWQTFKENAGALGGLALCLALVFILSVMATFTLHEFFVRSF